MIAMEADLSTNAAMILGARDTRVPVDGSSGRSNEKACITLTASSTISFDWSGGVLEECPKGTKLEISYRIVRYCRYVQGDDKRDIRSRSRNL